MDLSKTLGPRTCYVKKLLNGPAGGKTYEQHCHKTNRYSEKAFAVGYGLFLAGIFLLMCKEVQWGLYSMIAGVAEFTAIAMPLAVANAMHGYSATRHLERNDPEAPLLVERYRGENWPRDGSIF